jgi:hypothetical protein
MTEVLNRLPAIGPIGSKEESLQLAKNFRYREVRYHEMLKKYVSILLFL